MHTHWKITKGSRGKHLLKNKVDKGPNTWYKVVPVTGEQEELIAFKRNTG